MHRLAALLPLDGFALFVAPLGAALGRCLRLSELRLHSDFRAWTDRARSGRFALAASVGFASGRLGGCRLRSAWHRSASWTERWAVVASAAFFVEALGRASQTLLGRAEVLVANHAEPREHVFHLLLGIGVVDLEVPEVVEHAADPGTDTLVAVVDPAGHLALDHPRVVEVVALLGLEADRSGTRCAWRCRPA